MKENVGKKDRMIRSLVGPGLITLGYTRLGGRKGKGAGLAVMIAGALIIESAITKVCPLNAALGVDTRKKKNFPDKLRQIIKNAPQIATGDVKL